MIAISDLLRLVVEQKASDLHLTVGLAPVLRLRGSLTPLQTDPLGPDQTEALATSLASMLNSINERRSCHILAIEDPNMFTQEQIRVQLADNLRAVFSQLLLPRSDGTGRVAAFELMINTPSIAALIGDNKSYRISTDIQTGSNFGMLSLETSLVDLYSKGIISREEVMAKAQDRKAALQLMAQLKKLNP